MERSPLVAYDKYLSNVSYYRTTPSGFPTSPRLNHGSNLRFSWVQLAAPFQPTIQPELQKQGTRESLVWVWYSGFDRLVAPDSCLVCFSAVPDPDADSEHDGGDSDRGFIGMACALFSVMCMDSLEPYA